MLEGNMEHRDHMENVGRLGPGDVQWMKAGSGVIHSEMPQQEEGRMRGFQLWVNLPANEKMTAASYSDIDAADIPHYRSGAVDITSIAGELSVNGIPVTGAVSGLSTDPGYLDLVFNQDDEIEIDVPDGYSSLVYVYEGSAHLGGDDYELSPGKLARLSRSGIVRIRASASSRVLVMTGKPINEPIVHHGPFVMNTVEEIQQAVRDYSEGTLV
jgi:redox-sensitive bicupin YhaK (pirin superfamily)